MNSKKGIIICTVIALMVFAVGVIVGVLSVKSSPKATEAEVTNGSTETEKLLTAEDAVAIIQQEQKLYSAEQTAHKNVVLSTKDVLSVLGYKITKPWSKATYVIPIDVTYKACIDFSKMTANDIKVDSCDSSITITLPDPVIEMTSCEIRHDKEQISRQIFASTQSQEFFNKAVANAEQNIWAEVSAQRKQELLASGRRNAEAVLADVLLRAGFKRVNITYSSSLNVDHLVIDLGKSVENLNKGE